MKAVNTIAIVGVGLIGGSVGLAVRGRGLARHVVGVGHRAASLRKARRVGAVTETSVDLAKGVADAQLVVVCTPVDLIAEHVRAVAAACPPGSLITDAGSTKGDIVGRLNRQLGGGDARGVRFVGSHPMAGGEKTGPEQARADLYEGRPVVVTPTRRTRKEDLRQISDFWRALGGRVVSMSPAEHDRAVAATSHLPHLIAAVLAGSLPEERLPLASSGFADTTRVAAGDVDLWREILLGNGPNVLKSLARFEKLLASFRRAIERGDAGKLTRLLEEAKRKRDAVGS